MYAPETGRCLKSDEISESEIMLDFGEYISINKIAIFSVREFNKNVSVWAYNEVEKEWLEINDEVKLKSCYKWNDV